MWDFETFKKKCPWSKPWVGFSGRKDIPPKCEPMFVDSQVSETNFCTEEGCPMWVFRSMVLDMMDGGNAHA